MWPWHPASNRCFEMYTIKNVDSSTINFSSLSINLCIHNNIFSNSSVTYNITIYLIRNFSTICFKLHYSTCWHRAFNTKLICVCNFQTRRLNYISIFKESSIFKRNLQSRSIEPWANWVSVYKIPNFVNFLTTNIWTLRHISRSTQN